MNSKQQGIIEIIIATLIWGTLGIIIRSIELEAGTVVAYRSIIAAPIMIFLLLRQKHWVKNIKSCTPDCRERKR